MPGAPNRPPDLSSAAPPAPDAGAGPAAPAAAGAPAPPAEAPGSAVLRRLVASRIALSLDLWKGAPSPELLRPLAQAEAAYAHGEWREAQEHLDQLSVRFAEPRWPTLPVPFRELRVSIPPPQPPHWDPDYALSPPEREARRARRAAETQIALLRASVAWAAQHGIGLGGAEAGIDAAVRAFESGGEPAALSAATEPAWQALYRAVPAPKAAGPAARPPPSPAAQEPGADA
ncbi:MAG: hypothetical protein QXG65_02685 [Thermoplasmata archaeon]